MPFPLKAFAAVLLALGLSACATPETYPISGEECGPEDAVQTLDTDCGVPTAGI